MSDTETFVVPFDFSEHSRAALETALDLAARLGADVRLLHVIQTPLHPYGYGADAGAAAAVAELTQIREGVVQSLNAVIEDHKDFAGQIRAEVVEGSNVAGQIRAVADRLRAYLIVMGTHGRTGLAHVFLGSVAERTLRDSPCPVLTVRASDPD